MTTMIYFIVAFEVRKVKIGISRNLKRRLLALQMASPVHLKISASFPGTAETEHAMHERFAKARLHGEWFTLTREIEDFIRATNSGNRPEVNSGVVEAVTQIGFLRATPQQMFDIFALIFGPRWQKATAKLLKVHPRTIIRWKNAAGVGKCIIPASALEMLAQAYASKVEMMSRIRAELREGLMSPISDVK